MTTQELYELTRGHEGKPWMGGAVWFEVAGIDIEALLIGSAVKWLVENNYYHIFLRKYAADQYVASTTIAGINHERTSLLAALLAACKAVEEGR